MSNTATHISNEKQRFEDLFREFFPGLVLFALKYLPDEDTAKDICHGVFIRLWDKREEIDFSKSLKSYLFTSVYNRCMNHLRDEKKYDRGELTPEHLDSTHGDEYRDQLEASESESEIYAAIQELPEKCREIFVLNRFEEMKYSQIAEQLNISVKTVEAQMSKALKILRDKLAKYIHLWLWVILSIFLK